MGRNHLRVLRDRPGCRLVAVADPVPEVLAAATSSGHGPDARGFSEPLAMIAEADLDAVVLAAPDDQPPAAWPWPRSSAGWPS